MALAVALAVPSLRVRAEELAHKTINNATDQFILTKFTLGLGRGKGRSFKRQANILYKSLDVPGNDIFRHRLALNLVKYRNRAGWGHRDLLRVSHYKPSAKNNDLFAWATGKGPATHPILVGYEAASKVTTSQEACDLLKANPSLPWEAFPTEVLSSKELWELLLPNLGSSALIRNLGRMSSLGITLEPYRSNIMDAAKSLHPVSALSAWKVYSQGRGQKGSLAWKVEKVIAETLEASFYLSFGTLKKSEAKVFFALDISGSMTCESTVAGLNCREVAAAMVMVAMRQQPYMVFGFSSSLIPLDIKDDWRLEQVIQYIARLQFGSTDASLPIRYCIANKITDVDLFAVYTDNETNSSKSPSGFLSAYRNLNPNAKLATVALQGGAFSIADPNDPGQVDFVGFDPSVPSVMVSLAEAKLV
jgi:60 kDa SS-A/Ro ribonucleoprotein